MICPCNGDLFSAIVRPTCHCNNIYYHELEYIMTGYLCLYLHFPDKPFLILLGQGPQQREPKKQILY